MKTFYFKLSSARAMADFVAGLVVAGLAYDIEPDAKGFSIIVTGGF